MVCHSLLQRTTFCQTSPPWPAHLGWPHTAWLSFTELDKAVVRVIRLTSFLWLWFVCLPSDASCNTYHLTWVSLTERNTDMFFLEVLQLLTFRSIIHFKLVFVDDARYELKFTFFFSFLHQICWQDQPVQLKSLRRLTYSTIFSALNYLRTFVANKLYIFIWVYLGTLYSLLLICLSLYQHTRWMCWNQLVLILQPCNLAILSLLHLHLNFRTSLSTYKMEKVFKILTAIRLNQ